MDVLPPPGIVEAEGVPETDDDEVSAELADIFGEQQDSTDNEDEGIAGSDTEATENNPAEPARPGILERLLAKNDGQLNNSVAGIVRDARSQIDMSTTRNQAQSEGLTLAEVARKRRLRVGEGISEEVGKKRTKNAFQVLGRNQNVKTEKYAFADERFSGMKLRDCAFPESGLANLFEHFTIINIADITNKACELRARQIRDPLVFGALVKKIGNRTAKDGARYAVFAIANMPLQRGSKVPPLTSINLLLFGTAFEKHHMAPEGTVFAIRNPSVLAQREENQKRSGHATFSGHCLTVRNKDALVMVGHAADFGLCDVEERNYPRCGRWYHKGISKRCFKHTKALLKKSTTTVRPALTGQEGTGMSSAMMKHYKPTVNLSDRSGMMSNVNRYTNSSAVTLDDIQKARLKREDVQRTKLEKRLGQIMNNTNRMPKTNPRAVIAKHRSTGRSGDKALGATSEQRNLERARRVLQGLGFVLRRDGGLEPPPPRMCRALGLTVRTDGLNTGVHMKGPPKDGGDGDALLARSSEMKKRNPPKEKEQPVVPPMKKIGQEVERVDNGRRQLEAVSEANPDLMKMKMERAEERKKKKRRKTAPVVTARHRMLMAATNTDGSGDAKKIDAGPSSNNNPPANSSSEVLLDEEGDIELSDSSDEE